MTPLHLSLLGGFELRTGAGASVELAPRKARALLAYLAMQRGRPQSRAALAALLWPEAEEEQARVSLRQALAAVRRALGREGESLLVADAERVALDAGRVEVDAHGFERLANDASPAALKAAAGLYRGDLLAGFDARAPGFDAWAAAERERLRRLAVQALTRLGETCASGGDLEGAIAAATRLLALDPLHEPAHRSLMHLYARQGRTADALRQYALCREALKRELGVSPEAETERLHREILTRRRRDPTLAPSAEPAPQTVAAATNPPLPELRQAVVLAADVAELPGLCRDLDPEEIRPLLERFERAAIQAVAAHGGQVRTQAGGRLLAVFGHPAARGDEPDRALAAALALHRVARDAGAQEGRPIRLRIGVAAGPVLMGGPDDPWSLAAASGGAFAAAAALAARAQPGATLAAADVVRSLRWGVEADADGDGAFAVRRLTFSTAALPFVGRTAELAQLAQVLERCARGRGQVVLIRGEAGIGKTRLALELAARAAANGFRVVTAQALDFGDAADPVPALVRGLLDGQEADAAAAIEGAVAQGRLSPEQRAYAYDLLELPLPPALRPAFEAMDHEARAAGRDGLLPALAQAASARQPLLLLVEDVHWASPEAVRRLARTACETAEAPELLVMTARPENDPVGPGWRAAAGRAPFMILDLGPLSDGEARELAARYAGVDEAAARECVRRAEGHPLFLDQLLRAAAAGERVLPGSVRGLVLARLDQLPSPERAALQAASVLGQRFSLPALRHLLERPDYTPGALIDQALLLTEGDGLRFGHALIQEAVYGSLLRSRRQALHARAAAWFTGRNLTARAEHLEAAGDPEAAEAYLAAAREAAGRFHYEEALRLAQRSLQLAPAAQRFPAALLRADTLRHTGDTEAALAAYEEALTAAREDRSRAQALIGMGYCLRTLDRYAEALDALARAETLAAPEDDLHALAEIHTLRGDIHFPLGKLDVSRSAHEKALAFARRAADPALEARALSGLGDAAYAEGRLRSAKGFFDRCLALAREHRLTRIECDNLAMLAAYHYNCLEMDQALRDCRAVVALARSIGNLRALMLAHDIASVVLAYLGEAVEAEQEALRALELSRRLGMRRFEAEQLMAQAEAAYLQGRREDALALLEQAYRIAKDTGLSYAGPWILGLLARVSLDPAQRREALAEGEGLLAAGCVSHCHLHFYQQAIEAALEDRRWDEAERYCALLEDYLRPEPLAWTFWARRGRALARFGRGARDAGTLGELRAAREEALARGLRPALAALDAALAAA